MQGAATVEGGLQRVADELDASDFGRSWVARTASRVEGIGAMGLGATLRAAEAAGPWERLARALELAVSGDRGLVLALDETPWWIAEIRDNEGAGVARAALAGLRFVRQHDRLARHRQLLTGSMGLAGLARELDASAEINDLQPPVELGPLAEAAGRSVFDAELLLRNRHASVEAARRAHFEAGGSPHWIAWLARRAASLAVSGPIDGSAVEAALDDLQQPRSRDLFDDEARLHLRKHYGPRAGSLAAILSAVARAANGATEVELVTVALSTIGERASALEAVFALVDEFYLVLGPDLRYRFRNPLFRHWWLRFGGS